MIDSNFFITLYTDASIRPMERKTQIAWRGRCSLGSVHGVELLAFNRDINRAEMSAILYAVRDSIERFPTLGGVFVNSDNLHCVQSLWSFRKQPINVGIKDIHDELMRTLDGRWVRAKHVKAHAGRADIRSYMNRSVDKMTRWTQ